MKITIIYDNNTTRVDLITGWGFAALVEIENDSPLLFDTGNSGSSLLYNMKQLGIDPDDIGTIVISHGHYDHTGGLADILAINDKAEVYVPASIGAKIHGRKVIQINQPIQISERIFSTGELNGIEQSLILKTSKGIVIMTGCSHPGVGEILDAASGYGKIYGIIGGFHGFSEFNLLDGISLISPCHCTRYKEELSREYPKQYLACGAGLEIEL